MKLFFPLKRLTCLNKVIRRNIKLLANQMYILKMLYVMDNVIVDIVFKYNKM